jgi:TP901 family phage tail tape measure protein
MSLTVGQLTAYLDVDDSAYNRKLDKGESKFSRFGGAIGKAAVAGAAVAGAAVAAFAVDGVRRFVQFEQGMNEVFTLLPGMSKQAMGAMMDDTRAFVREMGVAHEDAVPALYQALSAGIPKENVFEFLKVAAKASKGGVTDLETAVDGITSVIGAYGPKVMDAAKASDLMFTAVKMGKTTFGELSASIANVSPIAAALGVNFGDVTAALASMTSQGTGTSVATTQLRQLLVELSKDGTKTSAAFQEVAGVGFQEFISKGGDVKGALELLQQAAGDNGVALQDMFGSVEAASAALQLVNDEALVPFGAAMEGMRDSAGATDAAYEQMRKGLLETLKRIWVQIKDLALGIGIALEPALRWVADFMERNLPAAINRFRDAMVTAGAWIKGTLVPILQGLVEQFRGTGEGSDGLSSKFADLLAKGRVVFDQLKATITTVLDAVRWAWDTWGRTLTEHAVATFGNILTVIGGALKVIQGVINTVMSVLKGDWSGAWNGIKQTLSGVWDVIKGIVGQAIQVVKTSIKQALDVIDGDWRRKWNGLKTAVSTAVAGVVAVVRGIPGQVTGALGDLGGLLTGAGRAVIQGFISGIRSGFRQVRETLSSLTSMLPDWKGPAQRDAEILRNAGQLVMGGFDEGLRSQFSRVKTTLGDMTDLIGMHADRRLTGPSYVHQRLAIPAAPVVNVQAPDMSSLLDEMRAARDASERLVAELRRQTDQQGRLARSEPDRVPG